MVKGLKNENLKGRNFALTIILGVFIAIMVITLANLIVSYVYEAPKYENYCKNVNVNTYPIKYGEYNCQNCTFSKDLQEKTDNCTISGGVPIYDYDEKGCTNSIKECSMCGKNFEDSINRYNRISFFVFALIGFVLIVFGLFSYPLLVQLILLPSGAVLVIEAAIKNVDNKLAVIIVLALLVVFAVYLALKKLK